LGIGNIIFILILVTGIALFIKRIREIRANIMLGHDQVINDRKSTRWKTMGRVAMGQSKMVDRPIAGFLHIVVYVGFVLINIEVLEIVIDGIFGTHRVMSCLGGFYDFLIGFIEVLALLVLLACVVFLIRRNILSIKRFHLAEMTKWPKADANIILIAEILLMGALLKMNAADQVLQVHMPETYPPVGSYPVSQALVGIMGSFSVGTVLFFERALWWFHIIGILAFLNYVPYSKHFHIILAFPNTWYSNLEPKGKFDNMASVKKEVELMMDSSADPYATPPAGEEPAHGTFGAKDVTDLSWKNLLDAYTCTECGRCSSVCPANITGKKLSPRKIMMDTRDRAEELGAYKKANGKDSHDGSSLIHTYITEEEIWACTSCNACVDACPVLIDPLDIIIDLRRNLIMEESKSPESITSMFNNIENNGAPWAFSAADRDKWITES
jgi:ferredoxin